MRHVLIFAQIMLSYPHIFGNLAKSRTPLPLNWREPLNQFIAYRKGERLSAYRLRRGMNISDMIC